MSRRQIWPLVACLSGIALIPFVLAGGGGPIRLVLTIWFLLTGAGMSIVPALGIREPRTELLAGACCSLVIDTLLATLLAALGTLTTAHALGALLLVCLLGAAVLREPRRLRWPR
jgi:predicted Na+-dependent transporter